MNILPDDPLIKQVEELSSGRSYYKYGMPEPSGDESCMNMFLC